jgi:tetratricopeptide (TPR) repeat protein
MKVITARLSLGLLFLTAALVAFSNGSAIAESMLYEEIVELQTGWAKAQYEADGNQQKHDFELLLSRVDGFVHTAPHNADLYVWRGIIKASYAGVKGGLGALGLVKEAKLDLEKAIALNGGLMQAAARTSLGTLYFQVPPWPIGFGSDKKAEVYLLEGLSMAPNDIDSNYFYAMYLLDQGQDEKARQYLERAYTAPKRVGRDFADQERRLEVLELLTKQKKQK